jgi:hypothetical protein
MLARNCELDEKVRKKYYEEHLRVYGSRRRIISKAEPVPVGSPPFVEKTLVGAVPTAFGF